MFLTLLDKCSAFADEAVACRKGQHSSFALLGDVSSTSSHHFLLLISLIGFLFFTHSFGIELLERVVRLFWTMGDSFICLYASLFYVFLKAGWAIFWYLHFRFCVFYVVIVVLCWFHLPSCRGASLAENGTKVGYV